MANGDAYSTNENKKLSKSYHMLIASEKAKKGIDQFPRLQNINDALFNGFAEEELQQIFEDLRFFFPDDKVYKRVTIFHSLDIFEGEHFKIRETYKLKREMLIAQFAALHPHTLHNKNTIAGKAKLDKGLSKREEQSEGGYTDGISEHDIEDLSVIDEKMDQKEDEQGGISQ